jgi:hypothetical protein
MNDEVSLTLRNHLRSEMRLLAAALKDGSLDPEGAAKALEDLSAREEAEIDAEDIEVDFDTGKSFDAAEIFAALGAGARSNNLPPEDPVDAALLSAIAIRDKISAERIVGQDTQAKDREAYRRALVELYTALADQISQQD